MPPAIHSVFHEAPGAWAALIGLGVYHGVNPGMGWLFAVALALQDGRGWVILKALVPITLGHAASVGFTAALLILGQLVVSLKTLQVLTAVALIAFGLYRLARLYRHPRWVGMRVTLGDLFLWSFLMATAHGAGLMLAPVLLALAGFAPGVAVSSVWGAALGVHVLVMLLTMALTAGCVYRFVGLAFLRWGWINFDLVWAFVLVFVGGWTLVV